MEFNKYLAILIGLFIMDTLMLPIVFSKNEGENDLPKSEGLGDWWRAMMVSDLANSEGQIGDWATKGKSVAFLISKVLFVGGLVLLYYTQSVSNPKVLLNAIILVIVGILVLKYIAYAGWFDDKQCANSYVSSFKSDHIEDIVYKVMYFVFSIVLAILIKYTPLPYGNTFLLAFLVVFPLFIMGFHYLFLRMMYMGCESGKGIGFLFDNKCAISPATFYKEYIFGSSKEKTDTASKTIDLFRRGITVFFVLGFIGIYVAQNVVPSKRVHPFIYIGVTAVIVFGVPFALNWMTTVDAERRVANDETLKITADGTSGDRPMRDIRCVVNKYGGISGYILILCIQLYILRGRLTT